MSGERAPIGTRSQYRHTLAIPTRWQDQDAYGHVNNVVYYSYFDTVLTRFLIEAGLDVRAGPVIGFAVESLCRFHKAISFPETIDAMLRVARLGSSSVRFEIGLFGQGEDEARAEGHFVHVFVDRMTERPAAIPPTIRAALERIL